MNTSDFVSDLPYIDSDCFSQIDPARLLNQKPSTHPLRILLLYGSVRARSFSRLQAEEAARLLKMFGAEARFFNPSGLPLPDDAPDTHPKVVELRELCTWSEGMIWSSPERHGAMTGIMKSQIDWIPLALPSTTVSIGTVLLSARLESVVALIVLMVVL